MLRKEVYTFVADVVVKARLPLDDPPLGKWMPTYCPPYRDDDELEIQLVETTSEVTRMRARWRIRLNYDDEMTFEDYEGTTALDQSRRYGGFWYPREVDGETKLRPVAIDVGLGQALLPAMTRLAYATKCPSFLDAFGEPKLEALFPRITCSVDGHEFEND